MENKEKELLLNRGLLLGLFFSVFPILDLMFGADMSISKYYSLFYGVWFVCYSVVIIFIGKEFKAFTSFFDFRSAFRVMFIVSALAFSILTVTRISLWNVFYPAKYIELNEARDVKLIAVSIDFSKSALDNAYTDGNLSDDDYDESLTQIEEQLEFAESSIADKWDYIKTNGISKSLFIGNLIYNLFFIAIYNAVLALFLRRKNEIA
jgi:hypothetical protein